MDMDKDQEQDQAGVELQPAANKDVPPGLAEPQRQQAADADATEADVSEVVLDQEDPGDQEDQEKQPMTAGGEAAEAGEAVAPEGEKNGFVKVKMEEEEEKFTGLNKEELLRVAGTPGEEFSDRLPPRWVRTRWALLVLFWLGWLGMLGGAVLIILQAPRCRDLPATYWWNQGPLYQVARVQSFTDAGNLQGVRSKVDALSRLGVKSLVIGPVHVAPPDDAMGLSFEEISPDAGSLEQLKELLHATHRKGMMVVLDLTPNYQGSTGAWFSNGTVTVVAEKLKSALVFWFDQGVDGVQLSEVERVAAMVPSLWADIRAIVQNGTNERPTKRVLIGVTERHSAPDVSDLLSSTGVDLLTSRLLLPSDPAEYAQSIWSLYSAHAQSRLAWNVGGRSQGHLASLVGPALLQLYQVLLFTLPGTPVVNYGDEIGLTDQDSTFPTMLWDSDEELNGTLQEERERRMSSRSFFRRLSELRVKERSLLVGDLVPLFNSSSSLAYMRVWDQSARYLVAINWAEQEAELELKHHALPPQADVVLATNATADDRVDLARLRVGAREALLLKFPYAG
ncbi:amino acid transporter heavy chain SLC3A2-like isoform X1 [Entelurus aequoreus]|uniref:amino acid transporter heavy chain SLC3A2-like isoform X1 n=1 Tax=Entelurus aequoreus TaxID=161455 RepID=UPI002B1D57B6|nr:amino acid transporter heavy chain SLC3A2-like isoform X1 [Entelurus aequoreus]